MPRSNQRNMEKFKNLLGQRRVWAAIVASLVYLFTWLGLDYIPDPNGLTDILLNLGVVTAKAIETFGMLVTAVLALLSYFKPKKNDNDRR